MKKQALRAITMLVSIVALAFVTAIAANAQASSRKLNADIPFDFVVGDKTLAAGEYSIRQITTSSTDGLAIRSRDGNHKAIRLTNAVSLSAPAKRASLTFRRYGDTYYLAQVRLPGLAEAREMLKSKAERSVERELAKNASKDNLAQRVRAEIVTITAEVE